MNYIKIGLTLRKSIAFKSFFFENSHQNKSQFKLSLNHCPMLN